MSPDRAGIRLAYVRMTLGLATGLHHGYSANVTSRLNGRPTGGSIWRPLRAGATRARHGLLVGYLAGDQRPRRNLPLDLLAVCLGSCLGRRPVLQIHQRAKAALLGPWPGAFPTVTCAAVTAQQHRALAGSSCRSRECAANTLHGLCADAGPGAHCVDRAYWSSSVMSAAASYFAAGISISL